jgi:exonuclease III
MDKKCGMGLRYSPGIYQFKKFETHFQVMTVICIAGTLKRSSERCLYVAFICQTGILHQGPKFDYKMAWFKRLKKHAKYLLSEEVPVVLAGDYNVIPTEKDVYKPERWVDNALFFPQSLAKLTKNWLTKDGSIRSDIFIQTKRFTLSGTILEMLTDEMQVSD